MNLTDKTFASRKFSFLEKPLNQFTSVCFFSRKILREFVCECKCVKPHANSNKKPTESMTWCTIEAETWDLAPCDDGAVLG